MAMDSGGSGTPRGLSRSVDGSATGILVIIGEHPHKIVAQPDPLAAPLARREPERPRGRAASVPHLSFNRKNLLSAFSCVCSKLYSHAGSLGCGLWMTAGICSRSAAASGTQR